MRSIAFGIIAASLLATSAFAGDTLSNVGLSNITLGSGGGTLGNSSMTNSSSLSGSRIEGNTSATTTYGGNIATPVSNGTNAGGVGTGFAQTTKLEAGANIVNNTSLSGSGYLTGAYQPNTNSIADGANTLNSAGRIDGNFNRTANSFANTGVAGYSGSQMVSGPGNVSNNVQGTAIGAGGAISGGAGFRN